LPKLNFATGLAESAGDPGRQPLAVAFVEQSVQISRLRQIIIPLGSINSIDDPLADLPCRVSV